MKKITLLFVALAGIYSSFAQEEVKYRIRDEKSIVKWMKESVKLGEFNRKDVSLVKDKIKELHEMPTDVNRVYNLGRAFHKGLQAATSQKKSSYGNSTVLLMSEAEAAYRFAIENCDCHGRANIMLGTLYNDEDKYALSAPYLEKGLKLKEGSDDWMIAANQYILSGAYTNNTTTEKYLKVYYKFKKYAPTHRDPYYQKMALLYVPYYEK